jgi:type II secretory pathway pseudopilin PulG
MKTARNQRIRRQHEGGFTLIEVLVGFAILLLVLIGLLPLFTRAIVQNMQGRESIAVTNHGGGQIENHTQLTFNNWDLEIQAGNSRQTIDYWSLGDETIVGDEEWVADPTGLVAPWQRTTEVRQFGISAVNDNDLDGVLDEIVGLEDDDHDGYFDNALPSGTVPNAIHLKELRVVMVSQKSTFGSAPTTLTLTSLKAF